jgi:hypothetical protein
MLEADRYSTINELAAAEKINTSYVSRLLRLALAAPHAVGTGECERNPGRAAARGHNAAGADGAVSGGVGATAIRRLCLIHRHPAAGTLRTR